MSDDVFRTIEEKVAAGERLSAEDGLLLYGCDDIFAVGRLANLAKERKVGRSVFYIVNHHINYTNICENRCDLCAYFREPGRQGAYTMSLSEIYDRAASAAERGCTELHIVGGCNPDLELDYFIEMLGGLSERHPRIHLQAFTAVEIEHMARVSGLDVDRVLLRLKEAGLGSMPGGGAEIFAGGVRQRICPRKLDADGWLDVSRRAHELGIRSNATMLYGHVETAEERIDHMLRLRDLQDRTGGFMSFIPLAFHPENTALSHLPGPTALLDLKTLAIGRLILDNFEHIKAFWIMLGVKLTQISLDFGVDDFNGTVVEERITHAAGAKTPQALGPAEIRRLIADAGREPVERNTIYRKIRRDDYDRPGRDWEIE